MRIRENIECLRTSRGWTATQLARRAGLSVQTITRLERGAIKEPTARVFLKIAKAFGVTADELANELLGTGKDNAPRGLTECCLHIPKNCRTFRKELRLTQPQLSARSGLNQSDISRLERGGTNSPGCELMEKLAAGLNVEISDLLRDPDALPPGLASFLESALSKNASGKDRKLLSRVRMPIEMDANDWYDILRIVQSRS